jgi:cell pole-organizing protein PopZ
MGQAGAQREPSMEEILASIRRIIENNEPADAASVDPATATVSRADADAADGNAQPMKMPVAHEADELQARCTRLPATGEPAFSRK